MTPGCGCPRKPTRYNGREVVTWGCSDNIEFGEKVAQRFTDRLETGPRALMLVNLHNNEVGREVTYHRCLFFNSYNVAGLCSLSQRNLRSFLCAPP